MFYATYRPITHFHHICGIILDKDECIKIRISTEINLHSFLVELTQTIMVSSYRYTCSCTLPWDELYIRTPWILLQCAFIMVGRNELYIFCYKTWVSLCRKNMPKFVRCNPDARLPGYHGIVALMACDVVCWSLPGTRAVTKVMTVAVHELPVLPLSSSHSSAATLIWVKQIYLPV